MRTANTSIRRFLLAAVAGVVLISACSVFRTSGTRSGRYPVQHAEGPRTYPIRFEEVQKFVGKIRPRQGDAGMHYRLGLHLQKRKKHSAAIAEFKAAVARDGGHVDAYSAMGISYDVLGEHDKAVDAYTAALRIDTARGDVYNNLGYSCLLQGENDPAIEYFNKALTLDDGNVRYRNNLALALAESGRYSAALAAFKISGDDVKAYRNIARLYYRKGLYPEARAHFEKAFDLSASDEETRKGMIASGILDIIFASAEKSDDSCSGTADAAVSIGQAGSLCLAESDCTESAFGEGADRFRQSGARVRIEVTNGNGVRRMARRVGNHLKGRNVILMYLSNAGHFHHNATKIYYAEGYLPQAYRLARRIPGLQRLERVAAVRGGNAEISILIGKDLVPVSNYFDNG